MTDDCISTTTIEYITKATLKMNTTDSIRFEDEIGDRPDALGMGIMGGEEPSSENKTANGVLQTHQTNGKVVR